MSLFIFIGEVINMFANIVQGCCNEPLQRNIFQQLFFLNLIFCDVFMQFDCVFIFFLNPLFIRIFHATSSLSFIIAL